MLTTDCGVEMDDQWALAHLLLSSELDLRAVVTTHAASVQFSSSTSAQEAAEVIARVLGPAAASRTAVVAGSDGPLPDARTARANPGVDLLLRTSREFSASRRLLVLAIGAATDVASAILVDPGLPLIPALASIVRSGEDAPEKTIALRFEGFGRNKIGAGLVMIENGDRRPFCLIDDAGGIFLQVADTDGSTGIDPVHK